MNGNSLGPVGFWLVSASLLVAGCGDDDASATSTGAGGNQSAASTGSGAASSGGSTASSSVGAGGEGGAGGSVGTGGAGGSASLMNFFVTSDTSATADLGGLQGADDRCQTLATAVGEGSKTWRAYLSIEDPMTHARDRIGPGPYYNAAGAMLAADVDALHAINGDADLFITEKGEKVNGQWPQSPDPNEHDILTGTTVEGMLDPGSTCGDWTMNSGSSGVGHSDGLGPGGSMEAQYRPWNSVHTGQCGNTTPGGGAGKIYCFVGK